MHLFVIFENLTLAYWTSTAIKPNHAVTFWPAQSLEALSWVLRLEVNLAPSFLVETSVLDTSDYGSDSTEFSQFIKLHRFLVFHIVYFYHLKYKITFCASTSSALPSFESAYPNANWLEREAAEMYGLRFTPKNDSRNLLLDYTMVENPMCRSFPCIGEYEVFYNPLEEGLSYYPTQAVEL